MARAIGISSKQAMFEDIAEAVDSWSSASASALARIDADTTWIDDQDSLTSLRTALLEAEVLESDVEKIMSECLRGLAVSFLTIFDGGTKLAECGRIYVVDENGDRLGEGLHDDFVSYLLDSGRMC